MEPIINISNSVKGLEVLYFPEAEVSKTKGSNTSFASFGGLSVLYFKDYNRFILQLNDWRYPLLRRLNIQSSGSGSYMLPALNGFTYNLKINSTSPASLQSLDALLQGTRKLEASPEDKLVRETKQKAPETGLKEVIGQTIKQTVHKVQNKAATLTTGTKYLTSTKKRINPKDIKNKNFRKNAHSKLNKNFFESNEKLSNEFLQKRKDLSSAEFRDYEGLRKFTNGPVMHLPREEIEETILLGKDTFATSSPMDKTQEVRGESRTAGAQTEKMAPVSAGGMTHYSG